MTENIRRIEKNNQFRIYNSKIDEIHVVQRHSN